jgi:hypothetical protein
MTVCTITPTPATSFGERLLEAVARLFSVSVVTPASIESAWSDSGLAGLDRATLEDIGAPPELIARAELREAWKIGWSLEAMRRM